MLNLSSLAHLCTSQVLAGTKFKAPLPKFLPVPSIDFGSRKTEFNTCLCVSQRACLTPRSCPSLRCINNKIPAPLWTRHAARPSLHSSSFSTMLSLFSHSIAPVCHRRLPNWSFSRRTDSIVAASQEIKKLFYCPHTQKSPSPARRTSHFLPVNSDIRGKGDEHKPWGSSPGLQQPPPLIFTSLPPWLSFLPATPTCFTAELTAKTAILRLK